LKKYAYNYNPYLCYIGAAYAAQKVSYGILSLYVKSGLATLG